MVNHGAPTHYCTSLILISFIVQNAQENSFKCTLATVLITIIIIIIAATAAAVASASVSTVAIIVSDENG